MKQLFLPLFFLFIVFGASAQVPFKFSFQGVAKNANGQPLSAGSPIKVAFDIHKDTPGGTPVRHEEHSLTVSSGGLFNVLIGGGETQSGTPLNEIDWGGATYFLHVELAADNVTFVDMGTTQLVSVPYAAYASGADHAVDAKKWINNDPVIQQGTIGQGGSFPGVGVGPRLIWHPGKGAFRAGHSYELDWEAASIGTYSFAGNRGVASGSYTTAFGSGIASGNYSFATGANAAASGDYSSTMGVYTEASGEASVALGSGVKAKAFGGVALGISNNVQDQPAGTFQGSAPSDRIFQIGNGSYQVPSNAITVLRNGNVGIGNKVLAPSQILDVGGRARIRHNGVTAGIYFDNSQSNSIGFIGMKNDIAVGIYVNDSWILEAKQNIVSIYGNLDVNGEIYDASDRRLKRDISRVNNSFTKLTSLQGYNYYWKDSTKAQTLQTGLIAQEVEELFPELVKTDEKGMKSVNYIGLVPHLIEAMKEQSSQISSLKKDLELIKAASVASSKMPGK